MWPAACTGECQSRRGPKPNPASRRYKMSKTVAAPDEIASLPVVRLVITPASCKTVVHLQRTVAMSFLTKFPSIFPGRAGRGHVCQILLQWTTDKLKIAVSERQSWELTYYISNFQNCLYLIIYPFSAIIILKNGEFLNNQEKTLLCLVT